MLPVFAVVMGRIYMHPTAGADRLLLIVLDKVIQNDHLTALWTDDLHSGIGCRYGSQDNLAERAVPYKNYRY